MIVRPFIPEMTRSELLTLMTGGLATIAGSVLGVYLSLGADPVAMLTTSVMAAPCALYLSKILLPESSRPATAGDAEIVVGTDHVNVIDAAASGAADGMRLAINVAAMLVAFLAFVAMIDYTLGLLSPELTLAPDLRCHLLSGRRSSGCVERRRPGPGRPLGHEARDKRVCSLRQAEH